MPAWLRMAALAALVSLTGCLPDRAGGEGGDGQLFSFSPPRTKPKCKT